MECMPEANVHTNKTPVFYHLLPSYIMSVSVSPTRRSAQKIPREPPPPYAPPLEIVVSPSEATPLLATPPPSPRRSLHRNWSQNITEDSQITLRSTLHDDDDGGRTTVESTASLPSLSLSHRTRQYFQPLGQKEYWLAALHLGIINFPFAL